MKSVRRRSTASSLARIWAGSVESSTRSAETEILNPDEHPKFKEKLVEKDYNSVVERLVIFHIVAYDWNCPQHITPKFTIEEMKELMKANQEVKDYLYD